MQFHKYATKGNNVRPALFLFALLLTGTARAADAVVTVPLNVVDEKGVVSSAGDIVISESSFGLIFTPNLSGLPAGVHGFHVHENGSCDPASKEGKPVAALAAGGHWDPAKTGHHAGPYGDGHMGDLPGHLCHCGRQGHVSGPRSAYAFARCLARPCFDGACRRRQSRRSSDALGRRRGENCLRRDQMTTGAESVRA